MSKIIRITDEQVQETMEEVRKALVGTRLMDGKFNFTRKFETNAKATVRFTDEAWDKMTKLLRAFDKEVAWHGVCDRVEGEENTYLISDIMVYPQVVTSASVEMDETEYAKWLQDNGDDERFYRIHFQGHSHVNMQTNPSGVDLTHQENIVSQLKKNGFYLFAIYNKRLDCTWFIYDMEKNIFFENKDIKVEHAAEPDAFIRESKAMVKDRAPVTYYYGSNYRESAAGVGGNLKQTTCSSQPKTYVPYDPLGKTDVTSRPRTQIGAAWQGKGSTGRTVCPTDYEGWGDDYDYYGYLDNEIGAASKK